jgi:hypothetical protein
VATIPRHEHRPARRHKVGSGSKAVDILEAELSGREKWKARRAKLREITREPFAGSRKHARIDSGFVVLALAAIELASERANAEGKPVHLGFTIDPLGIVKVATAPIPLGSEPLAAEPEPALEAALGRARKLAETRIADILAAPEMKSADEFGEMIGASRETVHQKRRRHEVLGLEGPKRGVRFPDWQLTHDGRLLPGLPELFAEIGEHPWAVYRFLVAEHPELEMSGVEALKQGRVADTLALAESIGRGATT